MKRPLGHSIAGFVLLFVVALLVLLPAALKIFTIFEAYSSPIVFWGKVVDENGQPVAGASADFEAVDKPWASGTGYAGIKSDKNGLFSLSNARGIGLYVEVSNEAYYQLGEKSMRGFHTGSNDMPTEGHPAIFVLRKRGPTEPLIMVSRGGKIARDGTPISMNLTDGRLSEAEPGDIQVQSWTNDRSVPVNSGLHYDWRCKITVPNGGLQPREGEFNFQAPEAGYKESDEIVMPSNSEEWRDRAERSYFVKLADGRYARVQFTMIAGGDHFFEIVSYLNPVQNHRNLESNSTSSGQ